MNESVQILTDEVPTLVSFEGGHETDCHVSFADGHELRAWLDRRRDDGLVEGG